MPLGDRCFEERTLISKAPVLEDLASGRPQVGPADLPPTPADLPPTPADDVSEEDLVARFGAPVAEVAV
ncbi:MAG: hypothetical protein WBG41_10505 [Acidimicrobiales bacterium]